MRLGERVTQGRGQQWEAGLGSAAWLYDGSAIMLPALTWQGASLLRSLLSHQVLEGLTKAIFCFFHLKPYCTLPITYGRVSSANEWATMRFWGVWLERPLNRKSEDICGKKRTHVFFTEEEKVWDLHDLNWLFQLLKGYNGLDGGLPKRYIHKESVNITLFRKRFFADVIKLRVLR